MSLNQEQKKQITMQSNKLKHKSYTTTISFDTTHQLKDFQVHENVLAPEKVTAIYLAKWLFDNPALYKGKITLDLGCGTGIQGLVMALCGAKKVTFTDISKLAIINTRENIKTFKLEKYAIVKKIDLFGKTKKKFDVIVFNHPFFPDAGNKKDFISLATRDSGKLIHRFFKDAKRHLTSKGIIIMPYFEKAGPINNPAIQVLKHKYKSVKKYSKKINTELHKGKASIYIISK
jgi:methylase of polypeptide subunit release factors